MAAQAGSKELAMHGIRGPVDLMPLPWDSEGHKPERISDADIAELQAEINAFNRSHKKKG
jgi:hypothetical protein